MHETTENKNGGLQGHSRTLKRYTSHTPHATPGARAHTHMQTNMHPRDRVDVNTHTAAREWWPPTTTSAEVSLPPATAAYSLAVGVLSPLTTGSSAKRRMDISSNRFCWTSVRGANPRMPGTSVAAYDRMLCPRALQPSR